MARSDKKLAKIARSYGKLNVPGRTMLRDEARRLIKEPPLLKCD
jgi:hypothetical protein